jgi:hypothetical protein
MGRKLDPYNAQDAILIHREVMRENKARFKTDAGALAAYNSGWDPSKWGNSETTDYLATIDGTRGRFATPMPAGAPARAGGNEPQKIHFENTVTLNYPNGSRAAEPVTVKKTVSAPRASGV